MDSEAGTSLAIDKGYSQILERLRSLRLASGLTLKEVESRSKGRWKAVVVGSYERGVRHLSLLKAIELCSFYGANITALGEIARNKPTTRVIIDLSKLSKMRLLPDSFSKNLARLVDQIASKRGDRNTHVFSIRITDLDTLQILLGATPDEILSALERRELLIR